MWSKWLMCLFIVISLCPVATGWAAEIHGRSSTQLLWFNDDFNDGTRQVDAAEYLRLSATNIDKEGKLSIYGYGRGIQDLNNGEGFAGRLYYLYGDYRGIYDKVDARLGRQFVNLSAGTAIVDGGQLDLHNVGPVGFTLLGGRDVIFGLDGKEAGKAGNFAYGASAYLLGQKNLDLELSWFRKTDRWDVARDALGASAKWNALNSVKLYGNTRFDLVSESFSEALGGIKYYPLANLVFTGEYYQSYPTFDTTSIYSVFAVDQYQEAVFRVDYTFNEMVSANAGYTREDFSEGALAHVYHLGCGVRPIEPLLVNVEYDNRQGYYGSTNGVIVDAAYDLKKDLQLAAGISYDVYQRDSLTGDEIARKYWGGAKYKLAKNMAASLRIEDDVNARYTSNVQGRFVFDYDF